eukprot:gene4188-4436_t
MPIETNAGDWGCSLVHAAKTARCAHDLAAAYNNRSRSQSPDFSNGGRGNETAARTSKRQRNYRRTNKERDGAKGGEQQLPGKSAVQLEEEALVRIQAAVAERHAAALQSPELQVRIEARLKEERARLEARLEAQLEDERQALLEKKRKIREEARKQQEELERILEENKRRLLLDLVED